MKLDELLNYFFHAISRKDIFQEKKAENYMDSMSLEEKERLARRIQFFLTKGETVDSLAEAYHSFCDYFTEERMNFVRTGTYRYQTMEETMPLYQDPKYMRNCMIGLGLSVYMWKI